MGNVEVKQAFLREFLALRCQYLRHHCLTIVYLNVWYCGTCRPDGIVAIANCYGLDGLEIESRCGRDFSHTSIPALGPIQFPGQWVPASNSNVRHPRCVLYYSRSYVC